MTELYEAGEFVQMKKAQKGARRACWLTALLSLAACAFLCTRVKTANWRALYAACVSISALAGWYVFLHLIPAEKRFAAEEKHVGTLLSLAREEAVGVLRCEPRPDRIPGGMLVRRVRLESDAPALSFFVNERKYKLLPPEGTPVRLLLAGRFVVGFEALEGGR